MQRLDLPRSSAECLACACENTRNVSARNLLQKTNAITVAGVMAAFLIAPGDAQLELALMMREAIAEERALCDPEKRAKCPHAPGQTAGL